MKKPHCSIIIPTLNEQERILKCVENVKLCFPGCEVIVVDGGSTDNTVQIASSLAVKLLSSLPGRGVQCRAGAEAAIADVFVFLHVDSFLSEGTLDLLIDQFIVPELSVATFSVLFDGPQKRYRFFEWAARYETVFTTYGDQVIVVARDFYMNYVALPALELFEDVAFFLKARKITKIHKLNIPVTTSVRRYESKGFWKMNILNTFLILAYLTGVKASTLHRIYYK
ncbi:TIGR04283 family arsenosugar biosynthesis glycosyltransferase [Aureispira]|nr:TIGR04283 family arsenosugar biosynthesis glycosyltransferase [Aureispira sp.]